MFARTPGQAIKLVRDDLQSSVSCVTRSVLRSRQIGRQATRATIGFEGHPPRVRIGRGRSLWMTTSVLVDAREDDAATGSWRTHTALYDFSLFDGDEGGSFLLAYHFHPSANGYARPHMHVDHDARWSPRGLRRAHLPTGRVACEAFVRMLIEDVNVISLHAIAIQASTQPVITTARTFLMGTSSLRLASLTWCP